MLPYFPFIMGIIGVIMALLRYYLHIQWYNTSLLQLFSKNILIYFSALQCWCISIEGICACVHSCLVLCKTFYNHLKLALVFVFIVSPRKCEHHALLTTECIQYISGSTQQLSRDTRTMFNSLFFEHTDIAQKSFLANEKYFHISGHVISPHYCYKNLDSTVGIIYYLRRLFYLFSPWQKAEWWYCHLSGPRCCCTECPRTCMMSTSPSSSCSSPPTTWPTTAATPSGQCQGALSPSLPQ